ncbi:MAG: hypothetical protein R3F19_29915 [Verrucomicrobiales bacterium]
MSLFRSFRLRIAALTAVVAGIVFGLFSIVAYSSIHNELEKSVDTRIMVEANEAFKNTLRMIGRSRMTRPRGRDEGGRLEREVSPASDREAGESTPDFPMSDRRDTIADEGEDDSDQAREDSQVFVGCMSEITDTGRNEIYRTKNWPADLPALASK